MRLAEHEEVHELLERFDLDAEEIGEFFRAHDIDPSGIIHYGLLLTAAAAKDGDSTVKTMIAMFAAGVTVGIQLSDERADGGRANGGPA